MYNFESSKLYVYVKKNYDLITSGQQVLMITLCVTKNLQLGRAPRQ